MKLATKLKSLLFVFSLITIFLSVQTINPKDKPNEKGIVEKNKKEEPKIDINHEKEIVFGQSIYKSGSFKLYGEIIQSGILACFNSINEQGGIQGKKLKLISMDDAGDPAIAEKNINEMLNKYKIDMFLGNMGTRSILKVLPKIEQGKIAMLFGWGGDDQLRSPNLTHIINGPGLILNQIERVVEYIIGNLKYKNIGIFHSDDSFSTEIAQNTISILKNYNITPVNVTGFNRYTMNIVWPESLTANIQSPSDKLLESDPKVIICLSTSQPTVKLISRFFEIGHFGTYFFGIDSTMLVGHILKSKGSKFYYSSAVPDPQDSSIQIVKQYQEDLKKYFPKKNPNILSLTYYISAKIIVQALKNITGKITKEKVLEQIEAMKNFNLDGFNVNFDPQTRHAYGQDISIIKG